MEDPKAAAEDLERRIMVMDTAITDDAATKLIAKLLFLDSRAPTKPIQLHVSSPGGNVTAAIAVLRTMHKIKAPIHTLVSQEARGMALWIVAAGANGHRQCEHGAVFSIEPVLSASSSIDPAVQAHEREMIGRMKSELVAEIVRTTRLQPASAAEFLEHGRSFSSEEAVAYGIVDGLLPLTSPK